MKKISTFKIILLGGMVYLRTIAARIVILAVVIVSIKLFSWHFVGKSITFVWLGCLVFVLVSNKMVRYNVCCLLAAALLMVPPTEPKSE